jgi:Uma2 family endonuclease
MVMTPGRVVLTYRDYAALPDDGRRYEIHEGELSVTPAPGSKHQIVSMRLGAAVHVHVEARSLGIVVAAPFDVILSDRTIVQPDIVFIATDRVGRISERGIEGAPTLVVEILSPSTRETDRDAKLRLYASYGVPWYWIVDPDARVVEIYRLEAGSYTLSKRVAGDEPLGAEPFPDLALAPAALWA